MYRQTRILTTVCAMAFTLLLLVMMAQSCQPEPAGQQALKLAGQALQMADDIRRERARNETITQLLTGLGVEL